MRHTADWRTVAVLILAFGWTGAMPPAMPAAGAADEEGEAPAWAKTPLPDWVQPFVGKHGLPEPWSKLPGPLAPFVAGLDRWQSNHFVVYRPESAKFLDEDYTPTKVEYQQGTLPSLEKVVAQYIAAAQSDRQQALALLTEQAATVARGNALVAAGRLSAGHRFAAEVQLAAEGPVVQIRLFPSKPDDVRAPAAAQIAITRDKEGMSLNVVLQRPDPATGKWTNVGMLPCPYWRDDSSHGPAKKAKSEQKSKAAVDEGVQPRSWYNRWLPLRIDMVDGAAQVWFDGRFAGSLELPADASGPLVFQLAKDDEIRHARTVPLEDSTFLHIDLAPYANDRFATVLGASPFEAGGVSFQLPEGSQGQLNLRPARWIEWQSDPAAYYEAYDAGSPIVFDPRMPMLRVPAADYIAAHVLAVAEDDPQLTSTLTLRAGSYGGQRGLVAMYDFTAAVPRRGELAKHPAQAVSTQAGPLAHVVVPMSRAIAQDLGAAMDIELTKEVRLAVRSPDPCRWRLRPLGLPSGVRIAAITLEKAALQMRVGSREAGHAFIEPQRPTFQVNLRNITATAQPYTLLAQAKHLDGTVAKTQANGRVDAHGTADVSLKLAAPKRGYYDLRVTLIDSARRPLERVTSFALLPPDTRKHRDQSPFGTWDFGGSHDTPSHPDEVGPLYVKAGLRYGMFGFPPEAIKKYGVLRGSEPNVARLFSGQIDGAAVYRKALEKHPDTLPNALVFHETSLSGDHNSRVPDLFHDRPSYELNEQEKKRFDVMWNAAVSAAQEMRKEFPHVKLSFGNGTLAAKEEFYRRKFPADLFDSAGNESGAFNRPPEAQPPDCVANNASLWMDRQLLDAHGYRDKPVTQCYEMCYPGSNPGNLSPAVQADYFVRNVMHSLAWGVPVIRFGIICDVGNSYYYGQWGSSGLCRHAPELNIKPAFVAIATMTRVLDGAKFARVLDLGSPSLYGLEFNLPDGRRASVLWTVRGRRPVCLKYPAVASGAEFRLIDDQANETALPIKDSTVEVTLRPTPVYLVASAAVAAVQLGVPRYEEKPAAKAAVISNLADLNDWVQQKTHNAQLEYYNFMTPRRLGDFVLEPVPSWEGREKVLKVTPRPVQAGKDTMPMYGVLVHRNGLPLPGQPTAIGLWVNGNSSWGRVIFELEDAAGQQWISIGAAQQGSSGVWFDETIAAELRSQQQSRPREDWNTNDSFGWSRFDFDGWRYVAFPLPGNYPGEGYHWPYSSQWYHNKDGVVHYPLVFKRLIIELPEKTLHVQEFAPPPRKEIYFKDLTVSYEPAEKAFVAE